MIIHEQKITDNLFCYLVNNQFNITSDTSIKLDNLSEILLKHKNKIIFLEEIKIKDNNIFYTKERNLSLKNLLSYYNFNVFNICKILNIKLKSTDINFSYINIDNNLNIEFYLNKKQLSMFGNNILINYFLYEIIENKNINCRLVYNTELEFLNTINESLKYYLPYRHKKERFSIEFYMDTLIVQEIKKISKFLDVPLLVLRFRLLKLCYGKN